MLTMRVVLLNFHNNSTHHDEHFSLFFCSNLIHRGILSFCWSSRNLFQGLVFLNLKKKNKTKKKRYPYRVTIQLVNEFDRYSETKKFEKAKKRRDTGGEVWLTARQSVEYQLK